MIFLWLFIWLVRGTPGLDFQGQWNAWAVSLVVVLIIDIFVRD